WKSRSANATACGESTPAAASTSACTVSAWISASSVAAAGGASCWNGQSSNRARRCASPTAMASQAITLPLMQQRPFRMLQISRFRSRTATNALNFALVLLIVEATELAIMSGLLVLALVIPGTVAGIAAGAAADVFPKRLQIFTADLLRALICIGFALQAAN